MSTVTDTKGATVPPVVPPVVQPPPVEKKAEKPIPPHITIVARLELMDTVIWYEDGVRGKHGRGAMITGKGTSTLALIVFDQEGPYGIYKKVSGCKHLDDPSLRASEMGDQGAFEVAPKTLALWKVIDRVNGIVQK